MSCPPLCCFLSLPVPKTRRAKLCSLWGRVGAVVTACNSWPTRPEGQLGGPRVPGPHLLQRPPVRWGRGRAHPGRGGPASLDCLCVRAAVLVSGSAERPWVVRPQLVPPPLQKPSSAACGSAPGPAGEGFRHRAPSVPHRFLPAIRPWALSPEAHAGPERVCSLPLTAQDTQVILRSPQLWVHRGRRSGGCHVLVSPLGLFPTLPLAAPAETQPGTPALGVREAGSPQHPAVSLHPTMPHPGPGPQCTPHPGPSPGSALPASPRRPISRQSRAAAGQAGPLFTPNLALLSGLCAPLIFLHRPSPICSHFLMNCHLSHSIKSALCERFSHGRTGRGEAARERRGRGGETGWGCGRAA